MPDMAERARALLEEMLGPEAKFNEGQLEAILALAQDRARVLLVQRTGWGKSLVYLIATRLLRDLGAGPTLLISPLLSLMRNQIEMAERIGIRATTINSTNQEEWGRITGELEADEWEILLISPERLANVDFRTRTLPSIPKGLGMFVVDEAHCISDWGHDFRPDYRRITAIVGLLAPTVPVLVTTATANDRVIADIRAQLGLELRVIRGSLARYTLHLQNIQLDDQAERLAWLADWIPKLRGSGIVYCLTVADCERVAKWLQSKNIDARPYHAELATDERMGLEQALISNEVKALVATVALGMGFDKPDLGFVIHFQRPGSAVAYYQQVGRAGRAVDSAEAILLNGREDDEISEYFIREAFPSTELLDGVIRVVENLGTASKTDIMGHLNIPQGKLEQCLKLLEIDGIVVKQGSKLVRSANPWEITSEYGAAISEHRHSELESMRAYASHDGCLLEYITRELDDPRPSPCGHCANCAGDRVGRDVDPSLVLEAITFLRRSDRPIQPRKRWMGDGMPGHAGNIGQEHRAEEGRALCVWGDAGWGAAVKRGKYEEGRFSDEILDAAAELISDRWRPDPPPTWVTAVPSLERSLVDDFAGRLAKRLGLAVRPAIRKIRATHPQKSMENSVQQARNVGSAFQVDPAQVLEDPVLLVDDIVNSGWTFTVCAALLREAGSGQVFPFALATTNGARRDW